MKIKYITLLLACELFYTLSLDLRWIGPWSIEHLVGSKKLSPKLCRTLKESMEALSIIGRSSHRDPMRNEIESLGINF